MRYKKPHHLINLRMGLEIVDVQFALEMIPIKIKKDILKIEDLVQIVIPI